MAEYRRSTHAVYDLKYHVIWCARRDPADLPDAGVVIVRGAVSPDHIHLLLSAPPVLSRRNWRSTSKADQAVISRRNSLICENGIGASICGRVGMALPSCAGLRPGKAKPIAGAGCAVGTYGPTPCFLLGLYAFPKSALLISRVHDMPFRFNDRAPRHGDSPDNSGGHRRPGSLNSCGLPG